MLYLIGSLTFVKLLIIWEENLHWKKKNFNIEKNCRVELWYTLNVFHTSLSFYATQIVNPFLNSRVSAKLDKVERQYGEISLRGCKERCNILYTHDSIYYCRIMINRSVGQKWVHNELIFDMINFNSPFYFALNIACHID